MKLRPTSLQRRLVRGSIALTGFAIGCALLGRATAAVIAAGMAAAIALSVLRHLVRMGDR